MTISQNTTIIQTPRNWSRVVSNIFAISIMMMIGSCAPTFRILAPSTFSPPQSPVPFEAQVILISFIAAFLFLGLRWAFRLVAHLFSTVTDEGICFPAWSNTRRICWLDIQSASTTPNVLTVVTSAGSRKINLVVFKQPEEIVGIVTSYLSIPEEIRWLL